MLCLAGIELVSRSDLLHFSFTLTTCTSDGITVESSRFYLAQSLWNQDGICWAFAVVLVLLFSEETVSETMYSIRILKIIIIYITIICLSSELEISSPEAVVATHQSTLCATSCSAARATAAAVGQERRAGLPARQSLAHQGRDLQQSAEATRCPEASYCIYGL